MMRRGLVPVLLLAAGAAAAATQAPQQPVFRAGVRNVAVYATVQDRTGRLVPDLQRSDFVILDDGKPVEIATFSNEQLPVTVAAMLDMSGSVAPEFARVRDAALHFVDALHPGDRVRIGTFGEEVAVSPLLTGEKAALRRVLREELWPGGGTPLWTALFVAMASLQEAGGRRVVLVLSDGKDSCALFLRRQLIPPIYAPASPTRNSLTGCVSFDAVRTRALAEEFVLYTIGMEGPGLDGSLRDLSLETGGGAFQLKRNADLPSTFARVVEELHHQYTLGFVPAVLDGRTHRLEVRSLRPSLTVRSRRSYIANGGDR